MEKNLSILLIEDEPLECQEIIRQIESASGVELVGVTNNIVKAMEFVVDFQPDAIILDLELHKGHGNGLAFLDSLREMNLSVPIYILVTTNNISNVTHEGARKMGADFIMLKSQEDYSAKGVIDFLVSLKNIIHSTKKNISQTSPAEPPAQKQQRNRNRIITELDRIGISPNVLGRTYLIDSIMFVINGQREKILTAIAEQYGKTEASAERAMQNAINKAWKTSHIDDLEKYYTARIHSNKGVPTIMEFIFYYAEKIKNER
jgi:DNA-binding NarL/FixJ family response regulator